MDTSVGMKAKPSPSFEEVLERYSSATYSYDVTSSDGSGQKSVNLDDISSILDEAEAHLANAPLVSHLSPCCLLIDFCQKEFSIFSQKDPSKIKSNKFLSTLSALLENLCDFLVCPTEKSLSCLTNGSYLFNNKRIRSKISSLVSDIAKIPFGTTAITDSSWSLVSKTKRPRNSSNSTFHNSSSPSPSLISKTSVASKPQQPVEMETESSDSNSPKPPAVVVKIQGDWKTFISGVNLALCAPATPTLRRDVVSLQTHSTSDHSKLLEYLSFNKLEFSAPPPKSLRPRKVVIKGLPYSTSPADIKTELSSRGFVVGGVVSMLHRITRAPLNLFLVDVAPCNSFDSIFLIDYILNLKVKISAFRPGRRAAQCHACQRFGHHSNICNFRPRCVKCGGSHISSGCDKPRTEPARCANCNGRHTANYLGCPCNPLNLFSSSRRPTALPAGRGPPGARAPVPPAPEKRSPASGSARRKRSRRPRTQKKSFDAPATAASGLLPSPSVLSTGTQTEACSFPSFSPDLLGAIGEIQALCSVYSISDILVLFSTINSALLKASSPEEKLSAMMTSVFSFFSSHTGGVGSGSK